MTKEILNFNLTNEQKELLEKFAMQTNQIISNLPFYIWIRTINHAEDHRPQLIVEHVKDKDRVEESWNRSYAFKIENMMIISIDKESPTVLSETFPIELPEEDLEELKHWISSNYDKLMKVWYNDPANILGYPIDLKWYD